MDEPRTPEPAPIAPAYLGGPLSLDDMIVELRRPAPAAHLAEQTIRQMASVAHGAAKRHGDYRYELGYRHGADGRTRNPDGPERPEASAYPAGDAAGSQYPRPDGDVLVLGPEVFASTNAPEAGTVLSWRGQNYVPVPDKSELPELATDGGAYALHTFGTAAHLAALEELARPPLTVGRLRAIAKDAITRRLGYWQANTITALILDDDGHAELRLKSRAYLLAVASALELAHIPHTVWGDRITVPGVSA